MSAALKPGHQILDVLDLRAAGAGADRDPRLAVLARRGAVPDARVREGARSILAEIEGGGSAGVRAANARVGGGLAGGRLVLRGDDLAVAAAALAPAVRAALEFVIRNVARFADAQLPASTRTTIAPGVEIERRWVPVGRVGAYVPGGAAAYPSSLVMTVVPGFGGQSFIQGNVWQFNRHDVFLLLLRLRVKRCAFRRVDSLVQRWLPVTHQF